MKALFDFFTASDFIVAMIAVALTLTVTVCLVQLFRIPPFFRNRFDQAVRRCGLHNAEKEFPVLVKVRPDKTKAHGVIYEAESKGLSPVDFDKKAAGLGAALGGHIYALNFGRTTSRVQVFLLPHKYAGPTVLGVNIETARRFLDLPNTLVVGATGSGKSYFLLTLLGVYAKFTQDFPVSITICDYKKSSFSQFEGEKNFYGYTAVPEGIRKFYAEFSERLEANDPERNKRLCLLLIDEYGALIAAQPKKIAEELKKMVANMLIMGRSLGCRVLIGVQRGDSEHFGAGARDQFKSILGFGNLSAEQKQMLFREYRESMNERNGLGEGYLLRDGQDIERVKVSEIEDEAGLYECIREAMNR